jgi:tryptophan-rich sensory protein
MSLDNVWQFIWWCSFTYLVPISLLRTLPTGWMKAYNKSYKAKGLGFFLPGMVLAFIWALIFLMLSIAVTLLYDKNNWNIHGVELATYVSSIVTTSIWFLIYYHPQKQDCHATSSILLYALLLSILVFAFFLASHDISGYLALPYPLFMFYIWASTLAAEQEHCSVKKTKST